MPGFSGVNSAVGPTLNTTVCPHGYVDHYQTRKQVFYGFVEPALTDKLLLAAGYEYQKPDPRGASFFSFPLFNSEGDQTDFSRSTVSPSRLSSRKEDTLMRYPQPVPWVARTNEIACLASVDAANSHTS